MLRDLRDFLGRDTVIELVVAFALGSAVVAFLGAVVGGLVIAPITASANVFGGGGNLDFVIHGRVFQTEFILEYGLVVTLVAAAAALLVHMRREVLWQDEELAKCPHCLSEIPAAASVCAACTRDVSAAS